VWLLNGLSGNAAQVGHEVTASNDKIATGSSDSGSAENTTDEIDRTEMVHELIQQAQNEKNPKLRIKALSTLSKSEFDDTATEEALRAALNDDDPSVREYAVQALAKKEGTQAAESLKQVLEDPDEAVRLKAAQSLTLEGQDLAL
jgi:HEAT repeat protein